MDRRKFLQISGATSVGLAASLTPNISHAAETKSSLNAADFGLKPNVSTLQSGILQKAINEAVKKKLPLFIPAGRYVVGDNLLPSNVHIIGVKGQTILEQKGLLGIFGNYEGENITVEKISFDGNMEGPNVSSIVAIAFTKNVSITQCQFFNAIGNGLQLYGCNGKIIDNQFYELGQAALFCRNSKNLTIMRNEIHDVGNNGILVWQDEKSTDGSIVSHNHIYGVKSLDGGNGQNGNGINVFKANNVIMSDNQITDCAYTAIRINDGNNCQITNNNCSNIGEVALYAEFGFNGVLINNNLVDTAGAGISMANLDQNGHLAVCKGNLLRNLTLRPIATSNDDARAYGIAAEADALIEGNVIENATNFGIGGGYGEFQRNISVVNNMLKDCGYGITASVVKGAGKMTISNNSINNAQKGNIVGFAWDKAVTDDLVDQNQKFDEGSQSNLNLSNNVAT